MEKKLTINDIAKAANVSKTTVSRFLNQKYENMSEETKQRIANTIDELNYSPNRRAQSLKNHRSYLIGISVADISNPYTSRLLKGINDELADLPYQVIIMDADNSTKIEKQNIQKLIADDVDGVIIQPLTNMASQYQSLIDSKIVTIQVDRYIDEHIWPAVVSDNFDKSFEVGEILREKHYKHVILLTNNAENISSRKNRINGLLKSIESSNMTALIVDVDKNKDWKPLIIDEIENNANSALYALNGELLWEAIRVLRSNHIQFPEDVGVIGYDDNGFADLITPALSAIVQSPVTIGKTAVNKVLDVLNNDEQIEIIKTQIPATFENRESL